MKKRKKVRSTLNYIIIIYDFPDLRFRIKIPKLTREKNVSKGVEIEGLELSESVDVFGSLDPLDVLEVLDSLFILEELVVVFSEVVVTPEPKMKSPISPASLCPGISQKNINETSKFGVVTLN